MQNKRHALWRDGLQKQAQHFDAVGLTARRLKRAPRGLTPRSLLHMISYTILEDLQHHVVLERPTCRARLTLSLLVSKCLQAKGVARRVGRSAHMLLPRGIAILRWTWGGSALLTCMRSGLYTVGCFPAGCGCNRGAVRTWAGSAVSCRPSGKVCKSWIATGPLHGTQETTHNKKQETRQHQKLPATVVITLNSVGH